MLNDMQTAFAETIAAGLKRRGLTSCSRWSEACRIMGQPFPGKWTFDHHPWLRDMHDSSARLNVGQKAAQMGYTETVMNKVFYEMDMKGTSCLYVLPNEHPDATAFSASRFTPALESSPHLSKMFAADVNNVGLKRSGAASLFIRGSKSRSQLKSIPTGMIILDEVDEMDQDNIPLAMARADGQLEKQIWMLSTPTFHNHGINKYFLLSSQNHFFFPCPHCSRMIELKYPDSLVVTTDDPSDTKGLANSYYICYECNTKLDQETKSDWLALENTEWVESYTERDSIGWHISQMYSQTISPTEMARSYLMAQIDPASEQEFYNSKLGLPHEPDGSRVSDDDIVKCTRSHKRSDASDGGLITLGVDVGKWLHWELDKWYFDDNIHSTDIHLLAKCMVINHGKCQSFEELDEIMIDYGVTCCVMDRNPETRKALEFANRFYGRVKLCLYTRGMTGKQINISAKDHIITVDRTGWMDLSLGRFRRHEQNAIMLPGDTDLEYKTHIKAPVRIYKKDSDGNPVGYYFTGDSVADHYAHARNYAEIALSIGYSLGENHSINGV